MQILIAIKQHDDGSVAVPARTRIPINTGTVQWNISLAGLLATRHTNHFSRGTLAAKVTSVTHVHTPVRVTIVNDKRKCGNDNHSIKLLQQLLSLLRSQNPLQEPKPSPSPSSWWGNAAGEEQEEPSMPHHWDQTPPCRLFLHMKG